MGTQTVRTCDVYGLRKYVQEVEIVVRFTDESGGEPPIVDRKLDLSSKACERLKRFIDRACSPPSKKAKP